MHSFADLTHSLYLSPARWRDPGLAQPSPLRLFLFHVLPFSFIPVAVLYLLKTGEAGLVQFLFTTVTHSQLLTILATFWMVQLLGVPLMAFLIQRLGDVIDAVISYREAFAIAALAPTPLWLASLFLFVPSVSLYLLVFSLAVVATGILIFRLVPEILRPEDDGQAPLLSGAIFITGLVGLVILRILTHLIWSAA